MPISQDLLEMLRCPRSQQPVRMASEDEITSFNDRIARGQLVHEDGTPVAEPLVEALITEDGKTLYRIDDDIPNMLIEKGIPAEQGSAA